MKNSELAIALAKAETEEAVIGILKECGYWDDYSLWYPLGDNSNNYSIIGNQQSSPDSAFVEKIINSIDACLNGECLKRGINPMGPEAPQSMEVALEQFYGIKQGGLMMLDSRKRSELAKNIIVAATGQTNGGKINLCIADKGEGQTPKRMPETILSISKSNKLKIPFVQGKFNMGGTGALPFCGNHRMQLIISRRCPDIPNADMDETYDQWSVTVVRREPAREGRKSSMYTYLTDAKGKVLTFEAKALPIIPQAHVKGINGFEYEEMSFGTFIKLYNYEVKGYKTTISTHLYYRLSLLIPNLALPIQMRETREYNANQNSINLCGLITRLCDDRNGCVEEGFPSSGSFFVDGQKIKCSVYLFKPDKEKNYRGKHEGVLFTINGQTQGILSDSFFNKVNLSYIKNSVLVIVDCSDIDVDHQEELFMTSRDRIRNSAFSKELEACIEHELREHPGLKKAAHDRRMATLNNKIADDKPLKDVLQNILKKSSVLSKLFIEGQTITAPFNNTATAGVKDEYEGKLHPTFFALKGKFRDGKLTKKVPCNADFRVQFTTDVQNDYFYRPTEVGALELKMDGEVRNDLIRHLSLYNGVATLTVGLPDNAAEGDSHIFETAIRDDYIANTFENTFYTEVLPAEDVTPGKTGQRHKPTDINQKGNQSTPSGFAIPEIIRVNRDNWEEHGMNEYSALVYCPTDEGGDYFLNMDNNYLMAELKGQRDNNRIELTKARYTYSMALIGMSIIGYYKNRDNTGVSVDVPAEVNRISTMIAPILIPMLESMAELDPNEIADAA